MANDAKKPAQIYRTVVPYW